MEQTYGFYRPIEGSLRDARTAAPAGLHAQLVHDVLLAHVRSQGFPCVFGKSVVNRTAYWLGVYPGLAESATTAMLGRDLVTFLEQKVEFDGIVSLLAVFIESGVHDERGFEALLWQQLQCLNQTDAKGWSSDVSRDPDSPDFEFSYDGEAFFIVGCHPASSRIARQTPHPTLAFNLHSQFMALRDEGRFGQVQNAIRARDLALQGSINPALEDYGAGLGAKQYSGRETGPDWRCPFHAVKV